MMSQIAELAATTSSRPAFVIGIRAKYRKRLSAASDFQAPRTIGAQVPLITAIGRQLATTLAGGLPAARLIRMAGGESAGRAFPVNPVRFSIDVLLLDEVVGDVIDDVGGGAELLLEHLGNLGEQKQAVDDGDVGRSAHGVQVA